MPNSTDPYRRRFDTTGSVKPADGGGCPGPAGPGFRRFRRPGVSAPDSRPSPEADSNSASDISSNNLDSLRSCDVERRRVSRTGRSSKSPFFMATQPPSSTGTLRQDSQQPQAGVQPDGECLLYSFVFDLDRPPHVGQHSGVRTCMDDNSVSVQPYPFSDKKPSRLSATVGQPWPEFLSTLWTRFNQWGQKRESGEQIIASSSVRCRDSSTSRIGCDGTGSVRLNPST